MNVLFMNTIFSSSEFLSFCLLFFMIRPLLLQRNLAEVLQLCYITTGIQIGYYMFLFLSLIFYTDTWLFQTTAVRGARDKKKYWGKKIIIMTDWGRNKSQKKKGRRDSSAGVNQPENSTYKQQKQQHYYVQTTSLQGTQRHWEKQSEWE